MTKICHGRRYSLGNMIICRCNNCCFERNLNLGTGFSYPQVYNRTVERMKNGELKCLQCGEILVIEAGACWD